MKIRVLVDEMGNVVAASPVEATKSKDTPTSGGIRPANPGVSMFEMEGPENIFQGSAQTIHENVTKLVHTKMSSNQLSRVYWLR